MNYRELKDLVIQYSHRTDLEENNLLDRFVESAAERIGRDCDILEMERTATLDVTDFAGLPEGFMRLRSLTRTQANRTIQLQSLTPMQFKQEQSAAKDSYAIFNGQIHINGTATLTLDYIKRPEQLTADAQINFVLLSAPNLYLYGTLMEVFIYSQDSDAMSSFENQYMKEVERVNEAAQSQRFSGVLELKRVD